jgi:xylan 1,4-beta-xylosidase
LTRRADGSLVLVVWNYAPPERGGESETFSIHFKNVQPRRATISRVDSEHGDPRATFRELGSPASPTQEQIRKMQQTAQLPAPEVREIKSGTLSLTLPTYGLAVIELK